MDHGHGDGDAVRDFDPVLASSRSSASDVHNGSGKSPGSSQRRFNPTSIVLRQRDSVFTKIAGSAVFQNFTLGVIVLNAIWICVDVEWNHTRLDDDGDGAPPLGVFAKVVENCFCVFFFFEVCVRFLAFEVKRYCIFDAWFVFDCILVVLLVLETWVIELVRLTSADTQDTPLANFTSFRLLRLLRLTRMARIMRFFPELMTLVKGMITAASAVSWALMFLLLVMYIFAILFTTQLGKPDKSESDIDAVWMFASMGDSMMTLFTNGVLGDNLAQTIDAILEVPSTGPLLMWVFIAFLIICGITLMNLLIGVLCQVIENTAKEEEDNMQTSQLKQAFTLAWSQMEQQTTMITEEDWEQIQQAPIVRKTVSALRDGAGRLIEAEDLDHKLRQMQESVFAEARSDKSQIHARISFADFAEKVGELRTDAIACPLEVALIKQAVSQHAKTVCRHLDAVEARLNKVLDKRKARNAARASKGGGGSPGVGGDASGGAAGASASCGSGGGSGAGAAGGGSSPGPGAAGAGGASQGTASGGLQPLPMLEEVSLDKIDSCSPAAEAPRISEEAVVAGTSCSAMQWRYAGDGEHSGSLAVIRCSSEAPFSMSAFLASVPSELLLHELKSRGPQATLESIGTSSGPAGACSSGIDASADASSSAVLCIEDMGPVL